MRASAIPKTSVDDGARHLVAARRPRARGQTLTPQAALARRRHDPAARAGAARRSGRPCRGRYRADAAAIRRPRHRRRRRRPAGRRTARLRRRMAADDERHVQSAAHPRQCRASSRSSSPASASTSSTPRAPARPGARSAATDRMPVFLVTSFPDQAAGEFLAGTSLRSSLARGDRVIAPSSFVSRAMIERYKIAPERITVIPRAVDTAKFSPAAVSADRVAATAPRLGRPAADARRAGRRAASRRGTDR